MYVGPCIVVSVAGSAGHSYRMPYCYHKTVTTCTYCPVPFHLLHWASPTVRPWLRNTNRWSWREQPLRLGMKEPLHCAADVLLPHTHPHNVLHSPSYYLRYSTRLNEGRVEYHNPRVVIKLISNTNVQYLFQNFIILQYRVHDISNITYTLCVDTAQFKFVATQQL